MNAAEKIAALRATHEAATPEAWLQGEGWYDCDIYSDPDDPFEVATDVYSPEHAAAIVSAHNALPALLTALEDVLAIARRELHDISCRFHSYAARSFAIGACDCWKARVENAIDAALAEVDHD